jgi:NADH dehydrogenase
MRLNQLTGLLPGSHYGLGRLYVGRDLRLPNAPEFLAAGGAAYAAIDSTGTHALTSCQHVCNLGRFAGHNAAADLICSGLLPYRQEQYVPCLDLSP